MKRDKAFLPVPPQGTPLLRFMLERLHRLSLDPVVVVGNNPDLVQQAGLSPLVRYMPDAYPHAGALGGMATGMAMVDDWAVMLACDLPLIRPGLVKGLIALCRERNDIGQELWDAVVPVVDDIAQPMLALYNCRCLTAMKQALKAKQLRAISFLPQVRVRYVTEEELRPFDRHLDSFLNVNYPDDWAKALQLLQEEMSEG